MFTSLSGRPPDSPRRRWPPAAHGAPAPAPTVESRHGRRPRRPTHVHRGSSAGDDGELDGDLHPSFRLGEHLVRKLAAHHRCPCAALELLTRTELLVNQVQSTRTRDRDHRVRASRTATSLSVVTTPSGACRRIHDGSKKWDARPEYLRCVAMRSHAGHANRRSCGRAHERHRLFCPFTDRLLDEERLYRVLADVLRCRKSKQ